MSGELEAFVIALILATVPNIIIKILEKSKSQQEMNKTSLEAADLSLDMLKDALCSCREYTIELEGRCKKLEEKIIAMENKKGE